jgi:hypothetical protein
MRELITNVCIDVDGTIDGTIDPALSAFVTARCS